MPKPKRIPKKYVATLRDHVARDKSTASQVMDRALRELRSAEIRLAEDITGAPNVARSFNRFMTEQKQAIENLRHDLYFRKVEVTITRDGGLPERRVYLVSKQRVGGSLIDETWQVVSWTAPVTAKLLDREPGTKVKFQVDPTCPIVRFLVESSAKYGTILPQLQETKYSLPTAEIFLAHERLLDDPVSASSDTQIISEEEPETPYQAVQEFGLSEIIELADVTQRDVMHLPFDAPILVEGPPGSGKTSIALMRVPCLIDRQWEELGLDPAKQVPFHEVGSMLVLVLNDEMVDYLAKLIRSVGVSGLRVVTFGELCRRICREARTLSGIPVRESPTLSRLKLNALAPEVYWAGFRASVINFWQQRRPRLERALGKATQQLGVKLLEHLDQWVAGVHSANNSGQAPLTQVNLPLALKRWRHDCGVIRQQIKRHDDQARADKSLKRLQRFSLNLVDRLLSRHRITRAILKSDSFTELCQTVGLQTVEAQEASSEWLDQARGRKFAESDTVLAAWLATLVSKKKDNDEQGFGLAPVRLTHVVIDEAQDISPCHALLVKCLLAEGGTITLVGDLRQRVSANVHFGEWRELGLGKLKQAVFALNHRQSKPLGEFVRVLHKRLFESAPKWKSSGRPGPLPRIRRQRGNIALGEAIAKEIRHWRSEIPNATVGVLFDGKKPDGLRDLVTRIEASLQDTLTNVYLAVGSGNAHYLGRIDCAVVSTVRGTKGLEFDAVVVFDPHRTWRRPLSEVETIRRNALYVSVSRARQGLSLIVDDRSELLSDDILDTVCEFVNPKAD